MSTIRKCLNEWNAIVEALGNGLQTVLIRKYSTSLKEFLLYPTKSYTMKEDFLKAFKKEYRDFAVENSQPQMKDDQTLIKYYAKIINILERPKNRLDKINKYHIWAPEHVRSYIPQKAHIWVLRVYELEKPVYTSRSRGIIYANTKNL
ncbi:MAG: DUF1802 family protein [Candidatus Aenigmatarchaeota archaeon]